MWKCTHLQCTYPAAPLPADKTTHYIIVIRNYVELENYAEEIRNEFVMTVTRSGNFFISEVTAYLHRRVQIWHVCPLFFAQKKFR